MICTFPYYNIDIDKYPSLKKYLLSFGIERLEQTGKKHIIDGKEIKARKKTTNKWFETQDCINYADDFYKPKIIYPETTQHANFVFDKNGIFIDKTCFMMLTDYPYYITCTLSSKLFEFAYKRIFSSIELGKNGYQYNKHALLKLPIIKPSSELEDLFQKCNFDFNEINKKIYKLYNISDEEIYYIEENSNF